MAPAEGTGHGEILWIEELQTTSLLFYALRVATQLRHTRSFLTSENTAFSDVRIIF
jgi:hypothetical protein